MVCDYCFLGDKDDGDTLIVQVMRDVNTKCIFAHAVPRKGVSHVFGSEQICKDIEGLGYKEVVIKTDNEPAMITLQQEIKSKRSDRTILENSPVGESQSNGVAERAVRAIANQVRTMRSAWKSRVGVEFPATHPVTAWLVSHAGDMLTKFQVGKDGKTGYERARGKRYHRELVEFGEKVFFRSGKLDKSRKIEPRWSEGVFLGMSWRTGVAFIGQGEQVIIAHATRRLPIEDRRKSELLTNLKKGYRGREIRLRLVTILIIG